MCDPQHESRIRATRARKGSRVQTMQLFHQLKQLNPSLPDCVVQNMSQNQIQSDPGPSTSPKTDLLPTRNHTSDLNRPKTDLSELNSEIIKCDPFGPKTKTLSGDTGVRLIRPDTLGLHLISKPPRVLRSPLVGPAQVKEPLKDTKEQKKCSTTVNLIPNSIGPGLGSGSSPCSSPSGSRSFTSVNLTLRPPRSEPQPPIDISTGQSTLTYSTSSFDQRKGTESRLQITVGPTGGSVSSYRRMKPGQPSQRPHSCHFDPIDGSGGIVGTALSGLRTRGTSLQDLTTSSVLMNQQVKFDRLKNELQLEKNKLKELQTQVWQLDSNPVEGPESRIFAKDLDVHLEKQLVKEILHLRGQCERLTIEVDQVRDEEFYREEFYVGQTPLRRIRDSDPEPQNGSGSGLGWSCPKCTFQNHPLLAKCEQCEMANICLRIGYSWAA